MTEQPPPNDPAPGQQWPAQPAYQPYPSGGPGQMPPGYPPPGTQAPASRGMAITAFVLAIFGLFCVSAIAAIVLAIIVLSRSKDGRDHGKGFAIAALVIAPLWLLVIVGVVIVGLVGGAERDSTGAITEEGSVRASSVKVGDCVEDAISGDDIYSVPAIPCSSPHRLEAYANFTIPGDDYPGDDEVLLQAEQGCADRFEGFVGVTYDSSTLEVRYLYPLSTSWRTDRGVTCFVGTTDPSTGTLRGSNR